LNKVKGESDSLAGLILELSGEIPKVNDLIPCGDFEFYHTRRRQQPYKKGQGRHPDAGLKRVILNFIF